jgi:hypothetical protein
VSDPEPIASETSPAPRRKRGRPRKIPHSPPGDPSPPPPPAPPPVAEEPIDVRDEPIEAPETKATENAPEWLLKPSILDREEREEISRANLDAAVALVSLVGYIHGVLATKTGYEGWRLTPEEKEVWQTVLAYFSKYLPGKNLPVYVALLNLAVIEGGKFVGYVEYRRERKVTRPLLPPKPSSEDINAGLNGGG